MISDNNLDDLLEFAKHHSKEIVESGKEHMPVLLVLDQNNRLSVAGIANLTEDIKQNFRPIMQNMLRKFNAQAYLFIVEGWMTDSQRSIRDGVRVSSLPLDDRSEVLMVTAVELGRPPQLHIAKIDNTPNGRKLREFRTADYSMEGRMVVETW